MRYFEQQQPGRKLRLSGARAGSSRPDVSGAPAHAPRLVCFVFISLLALCGCSTARSAGPSTRFFDFHTDTFAFANQLVWTYSYDAEGHWTTHRRRPKPTYYQHCFVLARSARQFFLNARFDATLPRGDQATYRRLVRQVVTSSPRHALPEERRIVIPGYADLRSFSADWEPLLKEECGGAWQCYFQRGNWRMIFPLSRRTQEHTAQRLLEKLSHHEPTVLHLLRFPQLSINHAVLVFAAQQSAEQIRFEIYDPNQPEKPAQLAFDRASRTFRLPANNYFSGGRVDAYVVYSSWDY